MLSSKIARNFNFIPFSCQRTSAPVAMSQILTVMSPDALTTRLLSGEIATEVTAPASRQRARLPEREFCIDNLLVRIHVIIGMIIVDRPRAIGV